MSDVTKPINLASEMRRLEPFVGHAARYIAFIDGNTQVQVPLGDVRTVAAVFAALAAASVPPDRERLIRRLGYGAITFRRAPREAIDMAATANMLDEAAAALALPTVGDWHDISSAPKDGTYIDLATKGEGRLTKVKWITHDQLEDKQYAKYGSSVDGWRHTSKSTSKFDEANIIAWMHIPAPPSSKETKP